jgi:hypothetical protein
MKNTKKPSCKLSARSNWRPKKWANQPSHWPHPNPSPQGRRQPIHRFPPIPPHCRKPNRRRPRLIHRIPKVRHRRPAYNQRLNYRMARNRPVFCTLAGESNKVVFIVRSSNRSGSAFRKSSSPHRLHDRTLSGCVAGLRPVSTTVTGFADQRRQAR